MESNEIQKPQLKELKSKLKKFNKKSKKKELKFTLPDDYPLFDSPYPPPVLDGHTCRYVHCVYCMSILNDVIMTSFTVVW